MLEKGEQLDRSDLAVLPPAPALGRFQRIGPVQGSIIVVPGHQFGQHWVHPPPILGRLIL